MHPRLGSGTAVANRSDLLLVASSDNSDGGAPLKAFDNGDTPVGTPTRAAAKGVSGQVSSFRNGASAALVELKVAGAGWAETSKAESPAGTLRPQSNVGTNGAPRNSPPRRLVDTVPDLQRTPAVATSQPRSQDATVKDLLMKITKSDTTNDRHSDFETSGLVVYDPTLDNAAPASSSHQAAIALKRHEVRSGRLERSPRVGSDQGDDEQGEYEEQKQPRQVVVRTYNARAGGAPYGTFHDPHATAGRGQPAAMIGGIIASGHGQHDSGTAHGGAMDPVYSHGSHAWSQPPTLPSRNGVPLFPLGESHRQIAMFEPPSERIRAQRSAMLNNIVGAGQPDIHTLMHPDVFPFTETTSSSRQAYWGVLHLKNIPFNTSRAEIIALVGRNSRMLNDNEEPVHIIMERVTGKTNDAFVEFATFHDAMNVASRFSTTRDEARVPRLGNRPIEIEISSQARLMQDLFPNARGVLWEGSRPTIKPFDQAEPWDGFKSFVTREEMAMLVKHVEMPQRSPFSKDCPERGFECMISTLKRMPWYMTQYITVEQRHYMFEACCSLLSMLKQALRANQAGYERAGSGRLTNRLLKRFCTAMMLCPGFTVCQKHTIAEMVGMAEEERRDYNMPRFAESWVHQYVLGPKPGIPMDVLEYYIAIIREETSRSVQSLSIGEKARLAELARQSDSYWGYFWLEVDYPRGENFDKLTLYQAAQREWEAIDRILRRALAGDQTVGRDGGDHDMIEYTTRDMINDT